MKYISAIILLLLPVSLFSTGLTKKEVLEHAFEHSEDLQLIKNEKKSAQSMEKEYRGKGLPTIEASVNYQYAPEQFMPYSFNMESGGGTSITEMLGGGPPSVEPWYANDATIAGALDQMLGSFSNIDLTPPKNTIAMELSLTQPIYAQGKISKGMKIAKTFYSSLDLKYRSTQFTLAQNITNAYNAAILADQNRIVQQQAVALAEETHRLTKARLISGKGNMLDTLNSRFSLQQAKFALRDAVKKRHMAIKNMLTLASMETDPDEIELTDSLPVVDFTLSEDDAHKLLLEENTALHQIDKGIELQHLQVKIAKCDFLPIVYAGASVSKITMFNGGDPIEWGDDQKVFIGTTIPIYSGGQKVQKVKQAAYEERNLQETRKKTVSQLELALTNYYEELAVAREECVEAKHLITLTEQGAEIASLSYEMGQITQVDLTNSKQQLSMSKLAYNSAVYKLTTAIIGIKTLLGDETLLSTEMEDK